MERSELLELLSPEGLRLLDSLPPYHSERDVLKTVSDLRKAGHSPALVAAVLTQARRCVDSQECPRAKPNRQPS